MKRLIGGSLVLLLILLFVFGYLYQYTGLREYLRAESTIWTTASEDDKSKTRETFYGTDPRGAERGILAGSVPGRVWVCVGGYVCTKNWYTTYECTYPCTATAPSNIVITEGASANSYPSTKLSISRVFPTKTAIESRVFPLI